MDAATLAMFNSATKASTGKLTEMARHNAAVETNNAAMLAIAARKAKADKMKTRYDYVKGRVGLVTQFKELKGQGLSDEQIVAFIPHLKDVVNMMNKDLQFMNRKRSTDDSDKSSNE